jgi:protein-tyrosine phosphatase
MRDLSIAGTFNARWAGPALAHDDDEPREPWLVRSAAIDALTDEGLAELDRLGIVLVVDLRHDSERPGRTHGLPLAHVALGDEPFDALLRTRGRELATAVSMIATAAGPVLVHCTTGVERTGLVVALALLASGHREDDVVADYVGESASHADIREAIRTVDGFGGPEAYLIHHGVSAQHLQSLRSRLGNAPDDD